MSEPTEFSSASKPTANPLAHDPHFVVSAELEAEASELISHYPEKRSAVLMLLHEVQERFGYISQEAVAWIVAKLEMQPIHVLELVTFYPMFRQQPAGQFQVKICRTLSCALGGAYELHHHFCSRLGLDDQAHGIQTSKDGKFSVEFVECLASCGTAPVVMVNEDFREGVTTQQADEMMAQCRKTKA